jgi:hypothetical protein
VVENFSGTSTETLRVALAALSDSALQAFVSARSADASPNELTSWHAYLRCVDQLAAELRARSVGRLNGIAAA